MKELLRIALIALLPTVALTTPQASSAAVYYVSASEGRDANSGSDERNPWKTLRRVEAQPLSPGDEVRLKRGDLWWESLRIGYSGQPKREISLAGYGRGPRPRICAAQKITGSQSWEEDTVSFPGKRFYRFRNRSDAVIYGIWRLKSGQLHDDFTFKGENQADCVNSGDFVYSKGVVWLLASRRPPATSDDCVVFGLRRYGVMLDRVEHVSVRGLEAMGTGYGGKRWHGGISAVGTAGKYSKGLSIVDCVSACNVFTGINAEYVDGLEVSHCETFSNARGGGIYIQGGSRNVLLQGIVSHHNGRYFVAKGNDRGGISIGGSGDWHIGTRVIDCVSHHNGLWGGGYRDAGIHLFRCFAATVQNCQSYCNGGPGIQINGTGKIAEGETASIQSCTVARNGLNRDSMYVGGILCFRPAQVKECKVLDNNAFSRANRKYKLAGLYFNYPEESRQRSEAAGNVLAGNRREQVGYELSIEMDPGLVRAHGNSYGTSGTNDPVVNLRGEAVSMARLQGSASDERRLPTSEMQRLEASLPNCTESRPAAGDGGAATVPFRQRFAGCSGHRSI